MNMRVTGLLLMGWLCVGLSCSEAPADSAVPATQPSGQASAKASAPSGNGVVFVEHKLHDPGMNNLHSHTLLAPEGWKLEGGLNRSHVMLFNMPLMMDVKLIAPDGRQARIMPALSFEYVQSQQPLQPWQPLPTGNMYMPPPRQSIGHWFLEMAKANPAKGITELELVRQEPHEALTQQLRQQYALLAQQSQQLNQTTAQYGLRSNFDTQATVVTLRYQLEGQPMEETVLICWYAMLTTHQGQLTGGNWGITHMVAVRDKPGVDATRDPIMQVIFQSLRSTPQWQAEMDKYWLELARIRAKGAQDNMREIARRGQIMRESQQQINDTIVSGWKDRQASQDRSHRQTIDAIREVTPYKAPSGETIRLPSHYNQVYTDGQGRYLLNNEANYNPNLDPGLNQRRWETVEKAQP